MGDVVSLVEKAEQVIDQQQAERTLRRVRSNTLTLADYLEQIRGLRKMGNLEAVIDKIPGARAAMAEGAIDEDVLRMEEAMILSMTRPSAIIIVSWAHHDGAGWRVEAARTCWRSAAS